MDFSSNLMGPFLHVDDEWLIGVDHPLPFLSPLLSYYGKIDPIVEPVPQVIYYSVLYYVLLD
jgi:hypothetical protein